ncbi:hypothetical protein PMG11_00919 [Penicillium brasilianum]|uniref:Zn(2)-C6 fungal-type domain-containing protein n=1 Tax=Penicillium brasilianum TaxID=104259 RepID=A0A0F7TGH7_PENBI|nr:hypothetical protein PMG11_00919 [Penicillium brasilianum]
MDTISDLDKNVSPQFALRACVSCKSSKKKCDKTLPMCNRCSRLCLICTYDDAAEARAGDFTSTFQAVFDRLERLESHVFASEEDRPTAAPDQCTPPSIERQGDDRSDWQLRPSLLQPSYLKLIVAMNLSKILDDRHTSVRAMGEKYLSVIHNYAPVISKERLEWRTQESEALDPNTPFLIFILSIILLTEEPVEKFVSSDTASPPDLYRTCKHIHTLYMSFNKPCIEMIQSGVLIALYEHAQCMGSQAYLTIGTCARMAGAIGLLSATSSVSSSSKLGNSTEEETNILLGIYILDRHIKMASRVVMKHNIYDYSQIIEPSKVTVNSLKCEADGCDILIRLQEILGSSAPADIPSLSTDARLNHIGALEIELQSLKVNFSDHRNDCSWHRCIATAFAANLCIYTYRQLQTAGESAGESFEQRRKDSLELLGLLMDISSSQHDLNTSTAVFPSPFPIIILFQVLDAMISLEKLGSDSFLLRERQNFMDMLLHFSTRWRLARRLYEALPQT